MMATKLQTLDLWETSCIILIETAICLKTYEKYPENILANIWLCFCVKKEQKLNPVNQ